MISRLIVFLTILFGPQFVFGQQVPSQEIRSLLRELEERLGQNMTGENAGSICAAVIHGDQVLWSKQFGWVDRERQVQASSKTVYLIGSISKSITGLALAKLVEQGIVKLDDPIKKYLPETIDLLNRPTEHLPITLRQLATHTAGLAREPELEGAAQGSLEEWESKVLAAIASTSFIHRPGDQYSYSNIGYGILGLAMSRATGKPFDKLIRELVFNPLQMDNSGFVLSSEMKMNLAVNYSGTRDYHLGRGYKYPNGGVYSTLNDMVRFAQAQLHTNFESLLTDSIWAEVQDYQIVINDSKDEKYGYGLGLNTWTDKKSHSWIYHNGMVAPGYSAALYCNLSSKMGIVILRNEEGSNDIFGIADEFLYRLSEATTGKD